MLESWLPYIFFLPLCHFVAGEVASVAAKCHIPVQPQNFG